MGTFTFPGGSTPAQVYSYQGYGGVYSGVFSTPNGRSVANGSRPIIVTRVRGYCAGKGGTRSVRYEVGGGASSYFNIGAASSAQTHDANLSVFLSNSTSTRFYIRGSNNNQFYFGRSNTVGTATAFNGYTWSGDLAGYATYVEAPSAPQSLSASAGDGSVVLSWSAPSTNGGSGVTDYVIHYSTSSSFSSYSTTTSGTTSKTISGLSANTWYFRVAARNAVTNAGSTWSVYSGTVSAIPGSVPDASGTPAASAITKNSFTATWSAFDDGGFAIDNYQLQVDNNPDFSSPVYDNTANNLSRSVTGLSIYTNYYMRVRAHNSLGWSVYSSTGFVRTLADVPDQVTGTADYVQDYAAWLKWTTPADNSSAITGYTIQTSLSASFTSPTEYATPSLSLSITDLPDNDITYWRVRANNAVGAGAYSATQSVTTRKRTLMDNVGNASIQVSGGVQVELRSNGGSPATVTLVHSALTAGTTATTIATLATGTGSTGHYLPGTLDGLALCADPAGNLYVVGRRGSNDSQVYIRRYFRTGTTSWTASGVSYLSLTDTGDPLERFSAVVVPGTGGSPVDTVFLLARRAGGLGSGALSYAVVSTAVVAASTNESSIADGSDPSWLGSPPAVADSDANRGRLDMAVLSGTRVAITANGFGVVDVTNGSVVGVAKSASNWSADKIRCVPVSSSVFVRVRADGSSLWVIVYSTGGSALASPTISGANFNGYAATDQWDVAYDRRTNLLKVYYTDDSSGRLIQVLTINMSTYVIGSATALTSTMGPASSTNTMLKTPRGTVDERRVLVTASADVAGTKSLASVNDLTGNVAPSAPALASHVPFDATLATDFAWAFGDNNLVDAQTAYDFEIDNLTGPTSAYASGKTASTGSNLTLAASAIDNDESYRWRMRTYDALDVAGSWSTYSTFVTADIGSVAITDPASDNPTSIVNYQDIVWVYTTTSSATQQAYRVKLLNNSTDAVLSDTGWVNSTDTTFRVAGIATDLEQRIEVYIRNTLNQETDAGTRLVTPSYSIPETPILSYLVGNQYVTITVDNPAPAGSRPDVQSNEIWKRPTGLGDYVLEGSVDPSGTYHDYAVGSGTTYEYFLRGIADDGTGAYADSAVVEVTASALQGVWIHQDAAPETTLLNFIYGDDGREEAFELEGSANALLGRTWAVADVGDQESMAMSLALTVPWDESHDPTLNELRNLIDSRVILVYRDNRRRMLRGTMSEISVDDVQHGSVVSAQFDVASKEA